MRVLITFLSLTAIAAAIFAIDTFLFSDPSQSSAPIIILFLRSCAFIVYWDVTVKKIGNIKYGDKVKTLKPVYFGMIVVPYVGFLLLYILLRGKLIKDAKDNPLDSNLRFVHFVMIFATWIAVELIEGYYSF